MNMEDEHGKRIIIRLTVGEEPRKKLRKPRRNKDSSARPDTAEGRTDGGGSHTCSFALSDRLSCPSNTPNLRETSVELKVHRATAWVSTRVDTRRLTFPGPSRRRQTILFRSRSQGVRNFPKELV